MSKSSASEDDQGPRERHVAHHDNDSSFGGYGGVYSEAPSSKPKFARDHPTPHPAKHGVPGAPYFDAYAGDYPYDEENQDPYRSMAVVEDRSCLGPARPTFPSPPASFDNDPMDNDHRPHAERTFSSLEAGEHRSRRGSRILSSLIRALPGHKPDLAQTGEQVVTKLSTYRDKALLRKGRRHSGIINHVESLEKRQKFILRLAKALLSFGAPSHRIESQLLSAADILDINAGFVHFPNLIMVSFLDSDTKTSETHFVRAGGRVALTSLHKVHLVYRDVLRDKMGASEGSERLRQILKAKPLYNIWIRCVFAFICASIICPLGFGGSVTDMFISGLSAAILQYLGLNAAAKSSIYANVYEISVSIIVSFVSRVLSTIPGNIFCYSAISSGGVVLILPGFTILIAALELTSRNIMCGSVRMVYAIIYTLFLGFGLTIGSDFYLMVNKAARRHLEATNNLNSATLHGHIIANNSTLPLSSLAGTYHFVDQSQTAAHIIKGCYRDPAWPWYRQPFPWWTLLFLVPIYSTCSSLSNLQSIHSIQLPVMVAFSCASYAANKGANVLISNRGDIVSAFGAFVIGLCGNVYSRLAGGTAFTSMVTGVLFLVPSAIGSGGGLIQEYTSSEQQYSSSFELGIRMIQVAIGVTIGLFVAQILVYTMGHRKNAAHFAF